MQYATQEDVLKRLEDEDPSPKLLEMIDAGLDDAADLIEHHVGAPWPSEAEVPGAVTRLAARAVARWIRNPDGFTQSRSADETLIWDDPVGEVIFLPEEVARLKSLAGRVSTTGFAQARVTIPGLKRKRPAIGYLRTAHGGKPFPFFFPIEEQRSYSYAPGWCR